MSDKYCLRIVILLVKVEHLLLKIVVRCMSTRLLVFSCDILGGIIVEVGSQFCQLIRIRTCPLTGVLGVSHSLDSGTGCLMVTRGDASTVPVHKICDTATTV